MQHIFISNIIIDKVRHLKNVDIPLSKEKLKHLIITGKNGSGKTSLLNSIATFLNSITCSSEPMDAMFSLEREKENLQYHLNHSSSKDEIKEIRKRIKDYEDTIKHSTGGVMLEMNQPLKTFVHCFKKESVLLLIIKRNECLKHKCQSILKK